MRRVTLILRGAVGEPGGHSVLHSSPTLARLAERGTVSMLRPEPPQETPELAYLGVRPEAFTISPGVLTASAFKFDPPPASVVFHLSLASMLPDGRVSDPPPTPTREEENELSNLLAKLETKSLVPRWGSGLDHVLFWLDGSLDMGTTPVKALSGEPVLSHLPEGDGESKLRMFIDDGLNILMESETNKRREGEGVALLNLFWPWGQGMTDHFPNLALKRGESVHFESRDARLAGLTRLFGYVHGDRTDFGKALNPNLPRLLKAVNEHTLCVLLLDHIGEAVRLGRYDEAERMLLDLEEQLLKPLALQKPLRLTLIALSQDTETAPGLCLQLDSAKVVTNTLPFDERVFDDKRPPRTSLWEAMVSALRP